MENEEIRRHFSGKIITGVELNTKVLGIPIEILGYNINPNEMQRQIDETYLSNSERNKVEVRILYSKAIDTGISLPDDFIEKYNGSIYGSKYFHSYIVKDESNRKFINEASWKDSNVFYREYMSNPNTQFFVDMDAARMLGYGSRKPA